MQKDSEMIKLQKPTDEQWEIAEKAFMDRQAARQLADESVAVSREKAVSIAQIGKALGAGKSPAALFASSSRPIPMNALRFCRALLASTSLASSLQARAASTEGDFDRDVGPYRMEINFEDDAVFLMIELGNAPAPRSVIFLHDDGRHEGIELAEPIQGFIQMGISRADELGRRLIALLKDPETAIYLH